jgi:hypothetical protein
VDLNRCRDIGYEALDQLDREQALTHQLDRLAPSRHARWPKADARSSARVGRDGASDGADRGPRRPGYAA